jgi:hypothetical protein
VNATQTAAFSMGSEITLSASNRVIFAEELGGLILTSSSTGNISLLNGIRTEPESPHLPYTLESVNLSFEVVYLSAFFNTPNNFSMSLLEW